jgi:VCBS repeat-containing protein
VVAVTITVTPVNDAPIATADEFVTDEDTPLAIAAPGILANDTDADGDLLTPTIVAGPASGTLVVNSDGSFNYAPNADFNGTDSFTYSVNDGTTDSAVVTVGIAVNAVNDAPVTGDDEFVTDEDTPLVIAAPGVLTNDSDVDGDPLTAAVVTEPANGVIALNADGSFTYTPNANYNGIDSFTYAASDGTTTTEATAYITVNSVPDVPEPRADAFNTGEDLPLTVLPGNGVLANDTNTEGTLSAELGSGPSHGTLVLNADGSFNYTPDANYFGPDGFTYVANNGAESSPETTVSILVQSINDAPVATDDAYAATAGIALDVSGATAVTANDVDVEGDAIAAALIAGPEHGTLVFNADGSFTYTPDEGYTGSDSFQYQLNDGISDSNVATVAIEVAPAGGNVQLDERPTSANDHYSTTADQPLVIDPVGGVLQNDADPEGAALVAFLFTNPNNGTVALAGDGSFVYTPNAGFVGQDSFMYWNSDGTNNSPLAAVTIDVLVGTASVVTPPADETAPTDDAPPTDDTPPTDPAQIVCSGEHHGNVFSLRAHDFFSRHHAASVDALFTGGHWWH